MSALGQKQTFAAHQAICTAHVRGKADLGPYVGECRGAQRMAAKRVMRCIGLVKSAPLLMSDS